jgi:carboxyl-terminal processing protease
MPRRNLIILLLVTLVAVLCYQRVQKNPYARVLANAMRTVENRSLMPISDLELFEGAMDGMLGQLDDYSTYVSPAELQAFQESFGLPFAGVGMELAIDPVTKQLTVVSPLVGWPASKAGIRAGDRILRIGKASTKGMSLGEAAVLLRGKPGEPIMVSVLHEGKEKPEEIKLVREMIQVPSVLGDTRNADGSWTLFLEGRDRIGYVRISSFTDQTAGELKKTLAWLTAHGMRGLVLDLRDDPGGYLDAAVDVCNLLIRSGVIVTTRGRDGRASRVCTAGGDAPFTAFPMAVLVNQETASAAEIVAACLQDHHRAAIVGQRSYGKGTVQEIIELDPGCGAMKLTTSSYWRPSGKNIQRPRKATAKDVWGVTPDEGYEVALSKDEFTHWQLWRARRDGLQPPVNQGATHVETKPFVDRQLRRAVEFVEKQSKDKVAHPRSTALHVTNPHPSSPLKKSVNKNCKNVCVRI